MTTTNKPPKAVRVLQIRDCILMACAHFDADHMALYTHTQLKCPKARKARAAVWVHMHQCGKSYAEIGRVFKKGEQCVRDEVSAKWGFSDEDWDMIKSMPRIWVSTRENKP